jgi:ferritin-like metal-binding protein YciE
VLLIVFVVIIYVRFIIFLWGEGMKDFYQLFVGEIKEIYNAERQNLKMIPEVMKAAKSSKLKELLKEQWEETKVRIERVERIASEMKEPLSFEDCQPIEGLWREWAHVVKAHYQDDVQDSAIIGFIQKIKHYEISVYGTLKTFAKHLQQPKVEAWLRESMKEVALGDKKLTEIAEGTMFGGGINLKASKKRCA